MIYGRQLEEKHALEWLEKAPERHGTNRNVVDGPILPSPARGRTEPLLGRFLVASFDQVETAVLVLPTLDQVDT